MSSCDVLIVNNPPESVILYGNIIRATVPNSTISLIVNVITSPNSTWKLYSNYGCTKEIIDKKLRLIVGMSYGYIRVTAQDNIATKLYIMMIAREAISSICDVIAVTLPNGASIGLNTITADVPINTESLTVNAVTSDYASWRLYLDANCAVEIINKQLNLKLGDNTAYIKVTAQDNTTTKLYTLKISRGKVIGQPFISKGIYPANVWDMQIFNDKIYLGFGNSSNYDPGPNAGPIPIIYLDPNTDEFVTENIHLYNSNIGAYEIVEAIDEEQIDIYRVLNGKLYIPGHDSRESWDLGNYYVMDKDSGWLKCRNIPKGIHVYDMAYFKGRLFAALGANESSNDSSAVVLMSEDNGNTWTKVGSIPKSLAYDGRVYSLFIYKDKLYAVDVLLPFGVSKYPGYYDDVAEILCFEENSNGKIISSIITVNGSMMIPGIEYNINIGKLIKVIRINTVNEKLLFIAGQSFNDHQWLPGGLYVSTAINSAEKISLPEQKALPMDTLVRGNTAYVLAYVKISNNEHINIVYKSNDLVSWIELFRFKCETFARSFEEYQGDFYFGLGCYTDSLPLSTGTILRVSYQANEWQYAKKLTF